MKNIFSIKTQSGSFYCYDFNKKTFLNVDPVFSYLCSLEVKDISIEEWLRGIKNNIYIEHIGNMKKKYIEEQYKYLLYLKRNGWFQDIMPPKF